MRIAAMPWSVVLFLALVAGVLLGACAPPHSCDPGQIDMGYACYSPPDGGADGSATVDIIPPDSVMCTERHTGFGYACNTAADCPCGLDFCVVFGGDAYCSKTGCLADPGICPAGFSCVDLAVYVPGLLPTCIRM